MHRFVHRYLMAVGSLDNLPVNGHIFYGSAFNPLNHSSYIDVLSHKSPRMLSSTGEEVVYVLGP